jgi:TolB-like protein/Flp pilus assembly protein TadD
METEGRNEQPVRQELERILSSPGFARNERLSRFLRFIIERHLDAKDDEIKESLVAVAVFGRKPDYDPKLDSIVRTEAGRLRARLTEYYAGPGSGDPLIIEVPKGGYIPLFRSPEVTPEPRNFPHKRLVLTVALAALAITLSAIGIGIRRLRPTSLPISIAVLPLENLSREPDSDYFVEGLTDEIIRNLSVIEGLAVRSRTSSFAFKGKPRDVREAGQQLGADYIVEGSVLRTGQTLRVNAQLVRVRDDLSLWSGKYDRELTDVFVIQDEISLGIVNNLRLHLGHGRRRYETSVDAYDLYLRAQPTFWGGVLGTLQSIVAFDKVIAKDPSFAPAYAGLGAAYAIRSAQFPVEHAPDELSKMRSAAEKAVQLDPLLAEAHWALALVDGRHGRWREAERSYRRAIELDPNRSRTFFDFAMWLLYVLGRNEEALQQLRAAEKADPLSSEVQLGVAWVLMSFGRYDEAAVHCLKMAPDTNMNIECLGRVRFGQGRITEAVQLLASFPRSPQTRGFLGYVYARSGRHEEAEMMAATSDYANEQALIYAGLGDKARVLEALERMGAVGAQRIGRYLNYPELALLRGDPRLKAFRAKVGLPE